MTLSHIHMAIIAGICLLSLVVCGDQSYLPSRDDMLLMDRDQLRTVGQIYKSFARDILIHGYENQRRQFKLTEQRCDSMCFYCEHKGMLDGISGEAATAEINIEICTLNCVPIFNRGNVNYDFSARCLRCIWNDECS